MEDLISRQQAIDAVEKSMSENPHENEIHRGMHDHEHRHFLTILMGLPSVQPDPCEDAVSRKAVLSMIDTYMNKSVELHYLPTSDGIKKLISILPIVTPKLRKETSDLISRTQAIYVASGYCHPANIATELAKLPTVFPDIIHCEDCKHYIRHDKRCGYWNHGVKPDMWCSQAERRTDE